MDSWPNSNVVCSHLLLQQLAYQSGCVILLHTNRRCIKTACTAFSTSFPVRTAHDGHAAKQGYVHANCPRLHFALIDGVHQNISRTSAK